MTVTCRLLIGGQVQGVGFRPFVYRLAHQHRLTGSVKNLSGQVEVLLQGDNQHIDAFVSDLEKTAPPLSEPHIISRETREHPDFTHFVIEHSEARQQADIHVPADFFTCDDCLAELADPAERRYRYPFINCTQCGPRYTLIRKLPYDRQDTSMQGFPLCPDCETEFSNPLDRRFHAQPLACPDCGPSLSYVSPDQKTNDNDAAIKHAILALKQGKILAVKGIGGYHLMCDALNEEAILRLRQRKQRPDKPLAVMFAMQGEQGLGQLKEHLAPDDTEQQQLRSPQRPIVLVKRRPGASLPTAIAPGLDEVGAFLPYSPLHHLLLNDFGRPLVATSGNISGEPVLTDTAEAEARLANVANAFLHHNRPIVRPADDSVIRVINRKSMTLRAGRGLAPVEISLPAPVSQPILAVGGHLKATVALAWQDRLVISPHIADLGSRRSMTVLQQVIEDLQHLYQVQAEQVSCDAHPDYLSSRWAGAQALPVTRVLHHHAHASVVAGQQPHIRQWLMFCWDGVGLGDDKTLWGGETFTGGPGCWQRVASFQPFFLPGADKAGREPWRSAAALRWQSGDLTLPAIEDAGLALAAWQKKINCPQSSAVGRLFDAAACLLTGIERVSFEGQAAMQLEAMSISSDTPGPELSFAKNERGLLLTDWQPLLALIQDETLTPAERAARFHNSLAQLVINQALVIRERQEIEAIGLSGGVFQNRYLVEKIHALAAMAGLPVYTSYRIPVNDGGLSYGQVIETLYRDSNQA